MVADGRARRIRLIASHLSLLLTHFIIGSGGLSAPGEQRRYLWVGVAVAVVMSLVLDTS